VSAAGTLAMFGLDFERVTLHDAVAQIMAAAGERRAGLVVTPNVDQVVRFDRDPFMHQVYQSAMHVYADGMPLVWVSRLLDARGLPQRVTGADLLPAVCAAAAVEGRSVYFMGGEPRVAQAATDRLCRTYSGLKVAGVCCPPYGFESDELLSDRLVDEINASGAEILFLGVGAPKQEKWGYRQLNALRTGPVLCVGAAFAFAAGLVPRAPPLVQRAGMEWAWRLGLEPLRLWRRYLLEDARFFTLAAREIAAARRRTRAPG
jgi:N-acetylglucosaminyldiphosphoundecaprenol N-acetyl-beta-D-mannosaminyltransferase